MHVCVSSTVHTITTHILDPKLLLTKKQAVACPPQSFIAMTLNNVNPAATDGHTSACLISKVIYMHSYQYN